MPTVDLLRIFVSGPSDTNEYKALVEKAVDAINLGQAFPEVLLRVVRFEDVVQPALGSDPQAVITDQIAQDWEIYLGIFVTRIGNATPRAVSGTVEEYRGAVARWKTDPTSCRVMLFFFDGQVDLASIDVEQLARVVAFRKEVQQTAIYKPFVDALTFSERVHAALLNATKEYRRSWGQPPRDAGAANVDDESRAFAPTLIDKLATMEDAQESVNEALEAMTLTLAEVADALQQRGEEAVSLGRLSGVSARSIRSLMWRTAGDFGRYTDAARRAIPTLRANWAAMTAILYEVMDDVMPSILNEDEHASVVQLVSTLATLEDTVATAWEGVASVEASQASLVDLNVSKDLSRAAYASQAATSELASVFGEIRSEVSRLRTFFQSHL